MLALFAEAVVDQRIEREIHDVVGERAADEELNRHIIDPLGIEARVCLIRAEPAIRNDVSHRASGGLVSFPQVGVGFDNAVKLEMPFVERVRRPGKAWGDRAA